MPVLLTACAGTNRPESVSGGECRLSDPPPYVVLGAKKYDQGWIDETIEAHVAACNWPRPKARPAALDANGQAVAPAPAKKRPGIIRRIKDSVKKHVGIWPPVTAAPPAPPPAAAPPIAPPAPPPDPLEDLLGK